MYNDGNLHIRPMFEDELVKDVENQSKIIIARKIL